MFSCSCFICSCVFLVLFLSSSFGLLSPYLHTWLSTPFCPSTSLCSGDSPEQRSAASWQRASPVLSLSGDHQWDLHPCACAKLAGGLPQSHTRHYGVCVATHSPASSPPLTVSVVCLFHPNCCHVQDAQIYTYHVSFPEYSHRCSFKSQRLVVMLLILVFYLNYFLQTVSFPGWLFLVSFAISG